MDTVVKTNYGTVEGLREGEVLVWKGIPFAEPPVGELRFCAPQQPKAWDDVKQTKEFRDTCPQIFPMQRGEPQDEDCLYLNIYASTSPAKKPVMVFIHGGAFVGGSGSQYLYFGNNLAEKDIVVVTLNYRLGVFGMFNFGFLNDKFASNIALRDQVAALKWVKENIAYFGGDENDIAIMGQSAGAISIACLLNVPSAYNYYNKAIAISCFPDMIKTKEEGETSAKRFLEFAGITSAEELTTLPTETLLQKGKDFLHSIGTRFGLDVVMPIADGEFLPEKPLISAKNGTDNPVPLLMSYTNEEIDVLFNLFITKKIALTEIKALHEMLEDKKKDFEALYGKKAKSLAKLGRDWLIKIPSEWYAASHQKHSPTYMYRFDYKNPVLKLIGLNAFHALDLVFIFRSFDNPIAKLIFPLKMFQGDALKLSERMQTQIVDFVKTGKVGWEEYGEKGNTMVFNILKDVLIDEEEEGVFRAIWKQTEIYRRTHK